MKLSSLLLSCVLAISPVFAYYIPGMETAGAILYNGLYYAAIGVVSKYVYDQYTESRSSSGHYQIAYHPPSHPSPPDPKKVCTPIDDMGNLQEFLQYSVFGQPIASRYVHRAISDHVNNLDPKHALTMILAGSAGVGKTYVSALVGQAIFGSHARYHVHFYNGPSDFDNRIQYHKDALKNEIKEAVSNCKHSIFVFDEVDKMPRGIIEVIKPYIDFAPYVRGVNYRHAIFLFLTNIGGKEINALYKKKANEVSLKPNAHTDWMLQKNDYVKQIPKKLLFGGGEADEVLNGLINHIVPFLPLDKDHVKRCILNEMERLSMDLSKKSEVVKNVLEKIEFVDNLSLTGCKNVGNYVNVESYNY